MSSSHANCQRSVNQHDTQALLSKQVFSSQHQQTILPLPPNVVAEIKSSVIITSLNGVIVDLVKNSLDANASRIQIHVDSRRGSCTVEDNGSGIAPSEFRAEGGFGKMHHTSRRSREGGFHGRNGMFIASLSALCLLTVVSHHHEHRSTNSITFHHSRVINRSMPALSQDELVFREQGTRVSVRDLFGNMPVRVKQRAIRFEEKAEIEKAWDELKRDIVGLVLAWPEPVSIRVKDVDGRGFVLNGQRTMLGERDVSQSQKRTPAALHAILSLLTQAELIASNAWGSWIPVSASTPCLSIKGAMSLDPAPSKHLQFISLDVQPLSSLAGRNDLYDEVNRLFKHSSFGYEENESEPDEAEKQRRKSDKRYKTDSFTNKQMRGGRKGIDQWPMFYLQIAVEDPRSRSISGDEVLRSESTLRTIIDVMSAMITQWLSVHHFRPRSRRSRKMAGRPDPATTLSNDSSRSRAATISANEGSSTPHGVQSGSHLAKVVSESSLKRKRVVGARPSTDTGATSNMSAYKGLHSFNKLSRIKSGNASFYNRIWNSKNLQSSSGSDDPAHLVDANAAPHITAMPAVFRTEAVFPGQLGSGTTAAKSVQPPAEKQAQKNPLDMSTVGSSAAHEEEFEDDTIRWTDPETKETFVVNARAGAVVPRRPLRPVSDPTVSMRSGRTLQNLTRSLRIVPKPSLSPEDSTKTRWIAGFLQDWDNPVFGLVEDPIPSVTLTCAEYVTTETLQNRHLQCSRLDFGNALGEPSTTRSLNISKSALREAEIISQVDRKFILVKLRATNESNESEIGSENESKDMLIIVDQHAADERCKVEDLFSELCTCLPLDQVPHRSNVGQAPRIAYSALLKPTTIHISAQEARLFTTHAPHFAAWGITYDITPAPQVQTAGARLPSDIQHFIHVRTLPSSIAERCKADPKVLTSLIRSEVWALADGSRATSNLSIPVGASQSNSRHPWLQQLHNCPQGILDLLNSRACRSAIMFNDALSLKECEELVRRLADCAFPFQCAHGRPSMMPLVELGRGYSIGGDASRNGLGVVSSDTLDAGKEFREAYKSWRAGGISSPP